MPHMQYQETDPGSPSLATKAFECVFTAATQQVKVSDFCTLDCHLPFDQAVIRLKEFDILIIPGGETAGIIKTKAQPLQLTKAFSDLQMKYPNKERTLMSIGTGLAKLLYEEPAPGFHRRFRDDPELEALQLSKLGLFRSCDSRTEIRIVSYQTRLWLLGLIGFVSRTIPEHAD